jgi:cytidyltransferase-like protein
MSGSAGGNRITRESVAKTVDSYINRILKKFPAFKSAKVSGSYNTSAKEDFGDIDLIVNLESDDKKGVKVDLAKFLSALPDDVIVPFKSEKYKGKKYLNTGEIVTILYPIEGQPGEYVQIDNIVSVSDDEAEFKKEFLDYPAEIQGLLLGLAKVICLEEDPKAIFARMGIKNIPELEANQEYEFNLSSAGLTLRIVTLDNFKETDRTEVWKTSNWSNIKRLFINYKIDGSFEDLLNDISSKVKNPRSKNRIKGIFNSMVSIKSGEVGTPKGDNKQKSLDKVNNTLSETNLGRYLVSLLLEQDQPTIALFPGKFKPPHKGHFSVVKQLLNKADQVVVLISPKIHDGISPDESVAAWELYKDQLVDGDKVELRVSAITPVKDVYDFVENNPELTVYAAYGKGEESRYKNLSKFPNAKIFDAGNFGGLNATDLRQAIRDGNEEEIKKFLPDGVEVADFLLAMGKKAKEEPKPEPAPQPEPQPAVPPTAPVAERKYQNQDDMFADYVLSRETDIEDTAQVFNIPIPDVRYAFTVGNMVVMSDDMWDKLENKNHEDADGEISGPPMILNYDKDRYYLTYGSRILADYKKLNKIPKVLMGVLDLEGPKPWPLKEYSDKIINQLVDKFKQEKPNLGVDIIKAYINRFSQIKNNPRVTEKDITKYNWKDLETTVDANQPKRIKAGKINDGEPSKDANLVYNQNGLRIYVGKTKNACIKYGNGYSFCISARGDDNMYYDYRYEQQGTPYFVFNDEKSSEQDKNGDFIDPTHLLVVFVHEHPELADDDDDDETRYIRYSNEPSYTVTTADNPGESNYSNFQSIESVYPELKGLEDIFKPVEVDPKEKAEYNLDRKYDALLGSINESYGNRNDRNYQEGFWERYNFGSIKWANKLIDEFINDKVEVYRFSGRLKPGAEGDYITNTVNQDRLVKVGGKISVEDQKRSFIEEIIIPLSYDGNAKNLNIIDEWDVTYKKTNTSDPLFKKYLEEVKELVDKYRNDLSKLRLMNEGLERKTKLNESETATIGEFVKYAIKNLEIQKPPRNLTFSYDNAAAKEKRSFGYFDPNVNKIWVYCKNRNMADILRTLAHELVHRKQDEDGRINYESGKTGSNIENEANAKAGILLRDFGKQHEEIYQ